MLRRLLVRDLAVLEKAELPLDASFVALTGETGAGKSLLVDAVELVCGGRGSAASIRTGAARLLVEAELDSRPEALAKLEEAGIPAEPDEPLVIRREISRAGKSRAFVNGSLVSLSFLSELTAPMLRIRGQSEAPELVDGEATLASLDEFAAAADERRAVAETYRTFAELEARCSELSRTERERESRLDFARFQLAEIRGLAPRAGEEEVLAAERGRLQHAGRIRSACAEATDRLLEGEGSASDQVGLARRALAPLVALVPEAGGLAEELDDLAERLAAAGSRAAHLAASAEEDPARLEEVDERLDRLRRLVRRHGATVTDLLEAEARIAAEVSGLETAGDELARLVPLRDVALVRYREAAAVLSRKRQAAAPLLATAVSKRLSELAMPEARLVLELRTSPRAGSPLHVDGHELDFGPSGFDRAQLLATTNRGEPLRPLSKIASGGELSRLQLALAAALVDPPAAKGAKRKGSEPAARAPITLVFDEIDAGVGGAAAVAVARTLRDLALRDQVLCVTHLASIAARATLHCRVAKHALGERTTVDVEPLDGAERVRELARMLAGEPDGAEALAHARALLAEASA